MTNKELAQALRSAASALEHGRYQTVRRKLALFTGPWFMRDVQNTAEVTPLSMPDSAIEYFDDALAAAESVLDNLLDKYSTEQIASYFELQVRIQRSLMHPIDAVFEKVRTSYPRGIFSYDLDKLLTAAYAEVYGTDYPMPALGVLTGKALRCRHRCTL